MSKRGALCLLAFTLLTKLYYLRMDKLKILAAAKAEIQRHTWGTFVDGDGRSMAQGGEGVVQPGCEACKKVLRTNSQYLQHLADDVMPVILRTSFRIANETLTEGNPPANSATS